MLKPRRTSSAVTSDQLEQMEKHSSSSGSGSEVRLPGVGVTSSGRRLRNRVELNALTCAATLDERGRCGLFKKEITDAFSFVVVERSFLHGGERVRVVRVAVEERVVVLEQGRVAGGIATFKVSRLGKSHCVAVLDTLESAQRTLNGDKRAGLTEILAAEEQPDLRTPELWYERLELSFPVFMPLPDA